MFSFSIEPVTASSLQEARAYLQKHENYTLFLLSNLFQYGYRLTEHPYSGNFFIARLSGEICAVFCLTLSATLLVQADLLDVFLNAS